MKPTQHIYAWPLFEIATSRRSLRRAWDNVRPRVFASKDPSVRAAAAEFEVDVEGSIYRLQQELRSGKFRFEPQRGVLKTSPARRGKPRKAPRPIVIAPVRSRIVQRAILNVCQSELPSVRRHLGALPGVIGTATSVGGLPGRGVPEAIGLIRKAIADGATWFLRSDLKRFFQTIPKPAVERFLNDNIRDARFIDLFTLALTTELANENEVREMLHLFPSDDLGVPQGSALSALCANIVLADFDAELNMRGILTVRYLDDFVILGRKWSAVSKAWDRAQEILRSLGMECHDPEVGGGKAAKGEIAKGFDFLSFHVEPTQVYPTADARTKFLEELRQTVDGAKRAINETRDEPRRAEPRFVQSLALLDKKIRGWGDVFATTTSGLVFAQTDRKIDELVTNYGRWFAGIRRGRTREHRRRLLGVALLRDSQPQF